MRSAPRNADAKPAQNTNRDPYAAVAKSTTKIARFAAIGCWPVAICATAPNHATVSARGGEQRLSMSATVMNVNVMTPVAIRKPS